VVGCEGENESSSLLLVGGGGGGGDDDPKDEDVEDKTVGVVVAKLRGCWSCRRTRICLGAWKLV